MSGLWKWIKENVVKESWVIKGVVGVFLGINAWQDWKTQEIVPWSIVVFGALGIVYHIFRGEISVGCLLGGVAIGIILMVISWISRMEVGMGDGLLLCVTGLYLGFSENFELILGGVSLCGFWSAILLIRKRVGRKTRIPFVPFLLLAYLGGGIW